METQAFFVSAMTTYKPLLFILVDLSELFYE